MTYWIPTGSFFLDEEVGGLPSGEITLIYGEAETGKTSLAIKCAINCALRGLKTFYVDSEGALPPERLARIASEDYEKVSSLMIFTNPLKFEEQSVIVDNLEKYVNKKFGLIIFDTITSLYRLELFDKEETFTLNRELNRQIATLLQIAKKLDLAVLLLSQVRSDLEETVAPVATRVLRFWSSTIIKLSLDDSPRRVRGLIERSMGKYKNKPFCLLIDEAGLHD